MGTFLIPLHNGQKNEKVTSTNWSKRRAFEEQSISQCDYTCTRVANLHTHMLTHTEVRAFNCDQCIKIFSRKSYLIKHSLSQAQMYEHKEPTFLTMRSPWFDYQQRICHALCLWVGFLKPKTLCKNIVLFA